MNAMERLMLLAKHGELITYARQLHVLSELSHAMEARSVNICVAQRDADGMVSLTAEDQIFEVEDAPAEDVFEALSGIFRNLDEFALTRRQLQQMIAGEQEALEDDERLLALDADLIKLAAHLNSKGS